MLQMSPVRATCASVLAIVAMGAVGQPAAAAPLRVTLEAVGNLATVYVPVDTLPSRLYTFLIDLDRPASYRDVSGVVTTIAEEWPFVYDWFHVEAENGNYVRSQLPSTLASDNIGVHFFDGARRQNVWGSGPTYGTFDYLTRVSFSVGSGDDRVQVDGLWPTEVPFAGAQTLLTPGAMWTIYDNGTKADGGTFFGYFEARIVSVAPVDATELPAPGGLPLVAGALGAMVFAGRYAGLTRRVRPSVTHTPPGRAT